MEDRKKTITAVALLLLCIFILLILAASLLFRKKTVSPIPDDMAIEIIFISPTLVPPVASPSALFLTPTQGKKP